MTENKISTDHIKASCGVDNTGAHTVCYIKGQGKITPTMEIDKNNGEQYPVNKLKNGLAHEVKKHMSNPMFNPKYIFTIELSETSPCFGKSSFLKFSLFYILTESKKNYKKVTSEILNFFESSITNLINQYNFTWTTSE